MLSFISALSIMNVFKYTELSEGIRVTPLFLSPSFSNYQHFIFCSVGPSDCGAHDFWGLFQFYLWLGTFEPSCSWSTIVSPLQKTYGRAHVYPSYRSTSERLRGGVLVSRTHKSYAVQGKYRTAKCSSKSSSELLLWPRVLQPYHFSNKILAAQPMAGEPNT